MSIALVVSIGTQNGETWAERERWYAIVEGRDEAVYQVWRETRTGPHDEFRVVAELTPSEVEALGLVAGEVKRA